MSTPMSALVFAVISVVLLLLFTYFALRRSKNVNQMDEAVQSIRSLDIEAFRNLIDPDEDNYLREFLAEKSLKEVRRERSRVALLYMKELSAASLQLARIGDVARRSADPAVAARGKEIADSAVYLRLQTLQFSLQMRLAVAFPSLQPHRLRPLLDQFDRANGLVFQHGAVTRAQRRAS